MGLLRSTAAIILVTLFFTPSAFAGEAALFADLRHAAKTGDVRKMAELKGAKLKTQAKVKRVWRTTKGHRDLLIELTYRGETFEALLRLAGGAGQAAKAVISATGTVIDFEPYPRDGRIAWQPVILAADAK